MAWGRAVWGRDLRGRGWNVPETISNLPLDLKRSKRWPRYREWFYAAMQGYLEAPPQARPVYMPAHLTYAAPNTQPAPTDVRSYASSPTRALIEGGRVAQHLSEAGLGDARRAVMPINRAARRRGDALPDPTSSWAYADSVDVTKRDARVPYSITMPQGVPEGVSAAALTRMTNAREAAVLDAAVQRQNARLRAAQEAIQAQTAYNEAFSPVWGRSRR